MQESRKQNVMPYEQTRVTINDLLTPSRAIVRVACELLTSLEMSIVNSALYLIILSGDLCWNSAHCIVVQKSFSIQKS